jgi:hypothetical protein
MRYALSPENTSAGKQILLFSDDRAEDAGVFLDFSWLTPPAFAIISESLHIPS